MKLAVQSEGYIKRYGIDEAIVRLKKIGYTCLSYCIEDNYNSPMVNKWSENELCSFYSHLGKKIKEAGMELSSVSVKTQMFSDWSAASFEMRKELYLRCVRACGYAACKRLILPLVTYHSRVANAHGKSRAIAEEMLDHIMPEAKRLGVEIALCNPCVTLGVYPFGCDADELAEFANEKGVGVVIDPVNAHMSGTDLRELIGLCGEKLAGIFVKDYESAFLDTAMPMMGEVDYFTIIEALKLAPQDSEVIMMLTEVYHRFSDLENQDGMYAAMDSFFYKMGKLISKGGGLE